MSSSSPKGLNPESYTSASAVSICLPAKSYLEWTEIGTDILFLTSGLGGIPVAKWKAAPLSSSTLSSSSILCGAHAKGAAPICRTATAFPSRALWRRETTSSMVRFLCSYAWRYATMGGSPSCSDMTMMLPILGTGPNPSSSSSCSCPSLHQWGARSKRIHANHPRRGSVTVVTSALVPPVHRVASHWLPSVIPCTSFFPPARASKVWRRESANTKRSCLSMPPRVTWSALRRNRAAPPSGRICALLAASPTTTSMPRSWPASVPTAASHLLAVSTCSRPARLASSIQWTSPSPMALHMCLESSMKSAWSSPRVSYFCSASAR